MSVVTVTCALGLTRLFPFAFCKDLLVELAHKDLDGSREVVLNLIWSDKSCFSSGELCGGFGTDKRAEETARTRGERTEKERARIDGSGEGPQEEREGFEEAAR